MGAVGNGQAWVAEVVFGTVAEDDHITMLLMLFEGIPYIFFLTQTVDKGEVAFEILGHIFADGVAAAFLETVVDTGEAVVFEDGGNDVGDGLVLEQAGIAQGLFLLMITKLHNPKIKASCPRVKRRFRLSA